MFFVKCFNNFKTFKITLIPQNSIFNFCNHKTFFKPIWNITFSKNVFIFWYSYMITNFKFRIFFVILFYRNQYICLDLHQKVSFWMCSDINDWIFKLYYLIYWYTHYLILNSHACRFCSLRYLIYLSPTTDSPSLYAEYISIPFFSNHDFIDLL